MRLTCQRNERKLKVEKPVELLLNSAEQSHGNALVALLDDATHLECMVAFAKSSALKTLLKPLKAALKRGMTARIAVGLSFHLTEPSMLYALLELSNHHSLSLFLSIADETFHPKIYVIRRKRQSKVIIGSANLTSGGLSGNSEASVIVDDKDKTLAASVEAHFDEMIHARKLIQADISQIEKYALEYALHDAWRRMAKRRADKVIHYQTHDIALLADHLARMKEDKSHTGFRAQKAQRRDNLVQAKIELRSLASPASPPSQDFLPRYEALINQFHSGGLHRGKTRIAENSDQFLAAIRDIVGRVDLSAGAAYDVLRQHFLAIKYTGVNGLTEILHAVDNKRYAVMNQNAVAGMMLAGFNGYPTKPDKNDVDGDLYARYCEDAITVQKLLGLANLTELDALFNYTYWQ